MKEAEFKAAGVEVIQRVQRAIRRHPTLGLRTCVRICADYMIAKLAEKPGDADLLTGVVNDCYGPYFQEQLRRTSWKLGEPC